MATLSTEEKDPIHEGSAAEEEPATTHALLAEAESCKDRGNVDFHKGKVLAKHTAGKNFLRDACVLYAEGLRVLGEADARLLAQRAQQQQQQQQQQRQEEGNDNRASAANTSDGSRSPTPSPPVPPPRVQTQGNDDQAPVRPPPLQDRETASLSKRADTVRPSLYLNLAACNLLLREWTPAIACCTHVLDECCGDALREIEAEIGGTGKDARDGVPGVAQGDRRAAPAAANDNAGTTRASSATGTSTGDAEDAAAAPTGTGALPDKGQQQQKEGQPGEIYGEHQGTTAPSRGADREAEPGADPAQEESGEREREAEKTRYREVAAKCLYRRAAALAGGGNVAAAREDLVRALRLKPRDAAISRELKKAKKQLAENEAKESLRRETEEGRRSRQQQQQRQADSTSEVTKTDNITSATADGGSAPTQQLARSPAPGADHAVIAGGIGGDQGGVKAPENQQQQGGRVSKEEEGKGSCSGDEESNERSQEQSEQPFSTHNGGECRDGLYAWNQSIYEVQVSVKIPPWARASDVRVDLHRSRLSVSVVFPHAEDDRPRRTRPQFTHGAGTSATTAGPTASSDAAKDPASQGGDPGFVGEGETATPVLAGALSRPVQVDECLWTMERPGRVLLYLQKELPADGEPGFEWWACVMEGDPGVDVLACDAGSDASRYPEHARRRGAKALWEHQNKSPEERLEEERMRDAYRQMEEEAEQRQRDLDKAMEDPRKAELYRQLKKTMPDTSISIK
ncbi:nuclear distribution protein NUDC (predicted) [Ectocarpus siliculosus]|uniref:Nuclear distribution protein NUDC (Predicted) n=1 Tax=Ectocarpus siliculosus TaxID=2880 RepID=D7G129_ECTSI|nr:nuclear distribution protein NUDC (predicted) [Ectocarpus siliculosus]|eukprot:CBJ33139.1 nuclear distribution protein NUDC (predicted) [Ectocarpus siliculosus]